MGSTFLFRRSSKKEVCCQTGLILEKNNMGDEEQLTQYSLEEVEKHNVGRGPDKSIWMVIHDKVFDVTKFLDEHPGGEEILIENAGLDATEAFEDVGHSTDAREMLREYLVGELIEKDRCEIYYVPAPIERPMGHQRQLAQVKPTLWNRITNPFSITSDEDRKGTTDSGPKSWATGTVQDDENSWTSWILPVMAALAASAFYRYYFIQQKQ